MMAGLLDIFGSSGSQTLGLLGMSPEDVQRARDDAQAQAMYTLAGRLFQGGNTGRSIAEGLQLGQQAYKQTMQGQLAETLQGAQIQELLRQRQEAQAVKQRQEAVNRIIGQAYQPAVAAQPAQEIYGEDIMGQRVGEGMTPAVQARPAQFDLTGATPLLMAFPEGRKALKELQPEYKEVNGALYEISAGSAPKLVAGSQKRDTVTVGNVVLDKNNMEVLYKVPEAPAASVKEFQDFSKLSPAEQKAYLVLQEQKRPSTTINMPTGEERKAAVLANRMNFGVAQMNEAIGRSPTAAMPSTVAEAAKFFTRSEFLANTLTPEQRQVVESAQLDVLDAALTLGTGAAYTREQLDGYRKSYFPQLGDSDATVKTKQKRLENLLQSAQIASGRAATSIPTKTPPAFEMPSVETPVPPGVIVRKR
jgi:hypothetical protein